MYCIMKKSNKYSINYQFYNLQNKFQMEINIGKNDENKFRKLFKNYLIFTDYEK